MRFFSCVVSLIAAVLVCSSAPLYLLYNCYSYMRQSHCVEQIKLNICIIKYEDYEEIFFFPPDVGFAVLVCLMVLMSRGNQGADCHSVIKECPIFCRHVAQHTWYNDIWWGEGYPVLTSPGRMTSFNCFTFWVQLTTAQLVKLFSVQTCKMTHNLRMALKQDRQVIVQS